MDYTQNKANEHKSLDEVLMHHLEEEMEDACEYARLAEEYPVDEKDFWMIGLEEVTHARHLKMLLERHGHHLSDEHVAKWHRIMHKYGLEK